MAMTPRGSRTPRGDIENPRFAHLWDPDGFESVCSLFAESGRLEKQAVKFLEKIVRAGEDYSKALAAAVKSATLEQQATVRGRSVAAGMTAHAWQSVVHSARELADIHRKQAGDVENRVCTLIDAVRGEVDDRFKTLKSERDTVMRDYDKSVNRLDQLRTVFIKANRDLADCKETESEKKRTLLIKANREYQQQIEDANIMQKHFVDANGRIMDTLQHLYVTRTSKLLEYLSTYSNLEASLSPALLQMAESMTDAMKSVNIESDLAVYVNNNRTDDPLPTPFVMESYKDIVKQAEASLPKGYRKKLGKRRGKKAIDLPPANPQFGVPLVDLMRTQADKAPGLDIPLVLLLLCDTLEFLGAFATEGIFRVAGEQREIVHYRRLIDHEVFRFCSYVNVHSVADLFKLFLRNLPNAVFPSELYDDFVIGRSATSGTQQMLEELLLLMPPVNRAVFIYVIHKLHVLVENSEVTKMTTNNLAMVFSPCLFRCPHDDPMKLMQCYEMEKKFLCFCIENIPSSLYDGLNLKYIPKGTEKPYSGDGFAMDETEPQLEEFLTDEGIASSGSRSATLPIPSGKRRSLFIGKAAKAAQSAMNRRLAAQPRMTAASTTAGTSVEPVSQLPQLSFCRAKWDWIPQREGDLSFKKGDTITLTSRSGGWWTGEINGVSGIFPCNYVEEIDMSNNTLPPPPLVGIDDQPSLMNLPLPGDVPLPETFHTETPSEEIESDEPPSLTDIPKPEELKPSAPVKDDFWLGTIRKTQESADFLTKEIEYWRGAFERVTVYSTLRELVDRNSSNSQSVDEIVGERARPSEVYDFHSRLYSSYPSCPLEEVEPCDELMAVSETENLRETFVSVNSSLNRMHVRIRFLHWKVENTAHKTRAIAFRRCLRKVKEAFATVGKQSTETIEKDMHAKPLANHVDAINKQLSTLRSSLKLFQDGEAVGNELNALVKATQPVVRAMKDLSNFVKERDIAVSSNEMPEKNSDKVLHFFGMTRYFIECMEAQLAGLCEAAANAEAGAELRRAIVEQLALVESFFEST